MTSRQLKKIKNLNTPQYNMGGYKSKYNVGGFDYSSDKSDQEMSNSYSNIVDQENVQYSNDMQQPQLTYVKGKGVDKNSGLPWKEATRLYKEKTEAKYKSVHNSRKKKPADYTYNEAFHQARANYEKTFTHNGKEYSTRLKEETVDQFDKSFVKGTPEYKARFKEINDRRRIGLTSNYTSSDRSGLPGSTAKTYNAGGIRKYEPGGMYDDNTVASTGQGNTPLNTSSIVYQENNPALQEQRMKGFTNEKNRLLESGRVTQGNAETLLEQGEEEGNLQGQLDAAVAAQNVEATQGMVKQGLKGVSTAATEAGLITPSSGSTLTGAFKDARNIYTSARAGKQAVGSIFGGTGQTVKGLQLVKDGAQTGLTLSTPATGLAAQTVNQGSQAASGLSKSASIGKSIGSFAKSGAGIGLIGTGLGYGVDALWGDDDPTTSNAGDIGGSMLKGAGTGATIGSIIPGVGTAIGAGVGALWGLGTELFGSSKARDAEKKAKEDAESKYKKKVKKIVTRSNEDLMANFGSNVAAVRAGELKNKTYSGYDLGRNVVAQTGGMRMGTPRYGYAA